jgi:hypothetical protein
MRYLDEDVLYNIVEEKYKIAKGEARAAYSDVLDTICEMPRADVKPRAEVAREIFEKIRNILNKHYYACYQNEDGAECDAVISYLSYVAVDFDRLEQKYTGGRDQTNDKG